MKSAKENLEQFTEPMKQSLKNLKDNISDTILDKMDEMKNDDGENQPQKKKGCLREIFVYGFVILAILAFFRNGCSFSSTIERDAAAETTQGRPNMSSSNLSVYDLFVQTTEDNIAALLAQEPVNEDALVEEYEALLTCFTSEYMFKSMAYGHFTGDYEAEKYAHIAEKSYEIADDMEKYLGAELADSRYTTIAVEAYRAFDDEVFDYDYCLVGTADAPDIDAMWENYFSVLAGVEG